MTGLKKLLFLHAMTGTALANLYKDGNQTVSEYKTITLTDPLTAGSYEMSAVVKSTDTDKDTCLVIFMDSSDNEVTSFQMDRSDGNSRVSHDFTLSTTASIMYLYASSNYWPNGVGDTATFDDIRIIYKGA